MAAAIVAAFTSVGFVAGRVTTESAVEVEPLAAVCDQARDMKRHQAAVDVRFDRLAGEGYDFNNFETSGERTARDQWEVRYADDFAHYVRLGSKVLAELDVLAAGGNPYAPVVRIAFAERIDFWRSVADSGGLGDQDGYQRLSLASTAQLEATHLLTACDD